VAYDAETQYVGRIEREEEAGVQLETLPKPYWQDRELFEEKKLRCWHLEELSTMLSTLRKAPNPLVAHFT